jgi:hypothetical protein
MNPATITAIIAGAAQVIEIAAPILSDLIAGKAVPAERQLALRQTLDALRVKLDSEGLGDHWKVD